MTDYYCDLAGTYDDDTGDPDGGGSGDIYNGPGGMQAAIRGTGNATALAAGDTLYCKGTANLTRLVKLTCGKDVSGWSLKDVVVDNNTGNEWSGLVCQLSVGADNTVILVELDIGEDEDNINLGSGINNTTAVDTTTLSAKACEGGLIDTNSGAAGGTPIRIIGVNASWVDDGTQAVFDGNGDALNCLKNVGGKSNHILKNLTLTNATGSAFTTDGTTFQRWVFWHCLFSDSNTGLDGNGDQQNSMVILCIARGNTAGNFMNVSNVCAWVGCVSSGSTYGFEIGYANQVTHCLAYENSSDNFFRTGYHGVFVACVADGSSGGSGVHVTANDQPVFVIGCRLTNNGDHGIESDGGSLDEATVELYNVFYGNTNGDLQNVTSAATSYGDGANHISDPSDDGFVDSSADDYNVASGKELRSTALVLNWDGV